MRNDFTSQVETREIADSDLDTISGGLDVDAFAVAGVSVTHHLPAPVNELVGHVTGLVSVHTN